MKCASIDVGTNTILLLIVDTGETIREIADISTTVRLGEGLKETGYISKGAMDRGLKVLRGYADMMTAHGVEYVSCVGTSALREAENGNEFSDLIENRLGIPVRIISERDEAYYTYLSVKNDRIIDRERFMIVDIGGGSTEIIAGSREAFQDFMSLPAGSVKLTEMFIRNDPPVGSEMKAMTAYIRQLLDRRFIGCSDVFVGTGGTVTTLASIISECEYFDKDRVHGFCIRYEAICSAVDTLQKMNVAERRAVKGMEKGREDIIVQGTVLLREMMSFYRVDECVVSAKGVRYGVLYEHMIGAVDSI
ncbi:MAG: Ppx/GppA phosphatase family protein [Syntrophorhabdaceae bacterium]|nr:Ppx/GppA phosphatase family protein [Syntrophorhabdaceae bacterium]